MAAWPLYGERRHARGAAQSEVHAAVRGGEIGAVGVAELGEESALEIGGHNCADSIVIAFCAHQFDPEPVAGSRALVVKQQRAALAVHDEDIHSSVVVVV